MNDEPEQGALFEIEGPDDDGCVWICSAKDHEIWRQNLGPRDQVVDVMWEWIGKIANADVFGSRGS